MGQNFFFKIYVKTKDAPIAVIIQEIPKFGGSCEPGTAGEDQRCIFYYKSHYHSLKFVNLRRLHIFIMLCLTSHEHSTSFHLFITLKITFSSIL